MENLFSHFENLKFLMENFYIVILTCLLLIFVVFLSLWLYRIPYYSSSYYNKRIALSMQNDITSDTGQNKVNFVPIIIARVPQGTNNSDSYDSEDEEIFNEDVETFDKNYNPEWGNNVPFPYTPFKKKSKITIEETDIKQVKEEELSNTNIIADSTVVGPLLSKISKNGFHEPESNKLSTIAVSIGLNCMYSVSKRKNNSLILELKSAVNTTEKIKYERFGYYWRCAWYYTKDGKKAAFQDVQKWYRLLKRKNPEMAKKFLKQEDERAGCDIPFQHIREYAKNHPKTKKLIKQFRDKDPTALTYLHLVDADVRDFNGVYSAYSRILQGCFEPPTVMSTGYVFPVDEGNHAYNVLSHMERMYRVITTFFIPLGTYYPEPNMCILIPQNYDTVEESFIDHKRGKGRTLESPILLDNIKKKRANVRAIFSEDNPIITTIPERAKVCKIKKKTIPFSHELKKGLGPTHDDIKKYAKVSQSHSNILNWIKSLFINKSIQYDKNFMSDGENIKTKNNELLKGVDKQCCKLITRILYLGDKEELKRELADRIDRENVDNIVNAIKAIEKFKKIFVTKYCWVKFFLLDI